MSPRSAVVRSLHHVVAALVAAVTRLDKSLSPSITLQRLRQHHFTASDAIYAFHILLASFWLFLMTQPAFPVKLLIPALYALALLVPFTSQFFLPATPIFAWLLTFYSSRFIPDQYRPAISVSLLPTLESVLYGANISDILTRFTHPILDIIAWIPYGVGHYILPFVVAAFLWLFRGKPALQLFATAFGYMNLTAVITQIVLPCSAPWYELIYGLTPATYAVRGSPGGLARIDALFGNLTYTTAFSNSPLVFGAFPSLHAGWATMEALILSHFFPQTTRFVWAYAGVLYWATMYLTHHYLVDVVGGACLATAFFYLFLPDDLRGAAALAGPPNFPSVYQQQGLYARIPQAQHRNKYEQYDLEAPRKSTTLMDAADFDLSDDGRGGSSDEEEVDITYRSPAAARAVPNFVAQAKSSASSGAKKTHRHTASIASLIRSDDRAPEDGWSPVRGGFGLPPAGK